MGKLIEVINQYEYKALPLKYYQRIMSCFKSTVIFYAFLFVGIGIISSFANAFYVVLFFFLLNLIEYSVWSKYYITRIEKLEGRLCIEYYEKDQMKVIEDSTSAFSFEVKKVWYKVRGNTSFLLIKHTEEQVLKQFLFEDIDETIIGKIAAEYRV